MNVELDAGYASKYFVTDAGRGVACAADPALLVSTRTMDVDLLGAFFAFLAGGTAWEVADHAKRAAAALRSVVDADFSGAGNLPQGSPRWPARGRPGRRSS